MESNIIMANQIKVKITDIPEGQLFKWNRVVYKKSTKSTDKVQAIDTRTGKEVVFYDGCKGILITDEQKKMETLRAEESEVGCEEHPRKIEEEREI